MCSSACNNFVELMTDQGNVRTIALGGRPDNQGPMIAVSSATISSAITLLDSAYDVGVYWSL